MAEFSHALNLQSHGRFFFFIPPHINHALLAMPGFKVLYTHLYTIIHNNGQTLSGARVSPDATTLVLFFLISTIFFLFFSCIYLYHKAGSNSVPSYCTGVT